MELRDFLRVVGRQRRLIALVVLLGLVIGTATSMLRAPAYGATATVLLQPNNPAERVTPDPGGYFDPERYASDQVSLITGEQVMQRAAAALDLPRRTVESKVSADVADGGGVVLISVEDSKAARASAIANAVAEAYIEDRRTTEVAALRRAADEIQVQLTALAKQIATLRRDPNGEGAALDAANLQYGSLFSRQQDLLIDSSLKEGGARIVSAASPASSPEGASVPVSALLGGLLAAMLGLTLAFLRDKLDDRIRDRGEVEALTGHPVLADLPVDRALSRRPERLAMQDDPLGGFAEATRALRTSISFCGVEEPIRCILVSSAVSGEGKTVVAANLAAAFAQAGNRTVLVSADLRRPRLDAVLGIEPMATGLSSILAAPALGFGRHRRDFGSDQDVQAAVEAALVATQMPDLYVLPAGTIPPNPAELLNSARMDAVLRELDVAFDVVILDTTPFLPVTDAAALATKVSHVLLVASAGTSRRRTLQRMMDTTRLTGARVVGVALNRAEMPKDLASGYYAETPRVASDSVAAAGSPRTTVEVSRRRVDRDPVQPARTT